MTKATNNLKRKPNEHILDYKYRICECRSELGLATWQDVRSLLNAECNESYSADTYRKQFEHWKQWKEHLTVDNSDILSEFEGKIVEVKKERIRLQDQRREFNALVRQQARFEYIAEKIEEAIFTVAKESPLEFVKPTKNFNSTFAGVALHSDWHVGLFTANYWNNFNNEELNRRVKHLVRETLKASSHFHPREMHIFNIGDLVNGLIHVTSRILATEDTVSQTIRVCEILSKVIADYSNTYDKIFLYFVNGNHDRAVALKDDNTDKDSFGRFVPFYLRARLQNFKNITFEENKYDLSIANADILGHPCLAVHGDLDKLTDMAQNLTLMTGVKPEYIFSGHIHRNAEEEVHSVELIVNQSLSGVDDFAKKVRKTGKPAQKFMIFEKKCGRYATFPIRLDVA